MKKRRVKRYRPGKEKTVMKFTLILGIIVGAVVCGYLTARFVLGPVLGYDTEVLNLNLSSKLTAGLENMANTSNPEAEEPNYVLQFGVFSSEDGAEALQSQLKKEGIDTKIEETEQNYKVISDKIATKEDALKQLETLKDENDIDVFIDAVD